MMLRLVIGEKGSGKTEYCIKNAVESGGGAIIIVPEQLSHRAEAYLAGKLGVFGLGNVEVLSFGQMARREAAFFEDAACRHIDNAGKVMLLYKIITEDKNFALLKGNEEEKAVCVMRLISEFKRYNVLPEDIDRAADKTEDEALKLKLCEISLAYKKFEEKIKGNFINADDNLHRFANSEHVKEKYKGFDIFIDSFTSFTQSELKCIEMFIGNSKSVTVTLGMNFEKRSEIRFFSCNNTFEKLTSLAKELGTDVLAPVILKNKDKRGGALEYIADNYFLPISKPYEKEPEDIECFAGKNMISEIEYAAAKIRTLTMNEGYLYRDFAVICSNLPASCDYIKNIFEKYDIKVFPDMKTNISNHPVASFLKSALDIIVKGYTYSNIFRCVKYGFFDISDKECDVLENFALESGARGNVWASAEKWEEFVRTFYEKFYKGEENEERITKIVTAGKKITEPLKKLHEDIMASALVKSKCKAIYSFMLSLNVPEKLVERAKYFEGRGEAYTAIEYKSVYNKIIDVLDEMCNAVGEDRMSARKFADVLNAGISQFEIGKIPALCDGVLCGGVESVKELSARVLFVFGMNEGVFPLSVDKTGFLNDFDRQRLTKQNIFLAEDAEGKAREGEYLIYRLFGAAEEKLYLSYSIASIEGSALREAWALQKIKELLPFMKQSDDIFRKNEEIALCSPKAAFENLILSIAEGGEKNPQFTAAYKWFKENSPWRERLLKAEEGLGYQNKTVAVSEEVLNEIYGDEMTTAVTRLEKFSACPFSYYMRYVLNAQPRKVFSFQAKDAGVFLHAIAEIFSKRLEASGKRWADVDEKYIKSEVYEILNDDSEEIKRLVQIPGKRGERFFVRLCAVAEYAISVIVEHIKRGKFQPMGYEIRFSKNGKIKPVSINLPDGKKVTLTGVIDRLDALENEEGTYFRIIDYKTGNREFDLGEIYHGITLQLAVYMCAAVNSREGAKPAGMLYFKFADPDIHDDPFLGEEQINEKKMKKVSLSGLLVSSEHILNSMDVSEKFDFLPVRKKKDGSFTGSIASEKNFEDLRKFVIKKVSEIANEIWKGTTDILPYKMKDNSPCDYCDFGDACHFDGLLGCRHRNILKLDKEEMWKEME